MKITANPNSYIFPPRANQSTPREETSLFQEMGWIAQLKYNDSRALIKITDNGIEYWNRHGEKFRTYHTPDHVTDQFLALNLPPYTLIDGGLLDQKHRLIKDTFVIWDILVYDNQHLIGTTYEYRYNLLPPTLGIWTHEVPTLGQQEFGLKISDNIFVPKNHAGDWNDLWDFIHKINKPFENVCGPVLEGLLIKDKQGTLDFGFSEKNNGEWQTRSRVQTGRHRF